MKYERFEDLPVWKLAIKLGLEIDELTERSAFTGRGDLRSQIRRAVLSISNNIAEGFEQGTTAGVITYIYTARGSAGEVRSMLCFTEQARWGAPFRAKIPALKAMAESCSRQLRGWADSLQNSEIKGQRHLNDATRGQFERAKRMDAFWEKLQLVREGADPRELFGPLDDEEESK